MAKPEVLAKVDADLERGHTHLAAQRLNSLLSTSLYDLDVRARLAAVHRRTGNFAEAGRWGFLTEDVTPAEVTAFAKAYYRSAYHQLRSLHLLGETPGGLGPLASERFAVLADRATTPPTGPLRQPSVVAAPRSPTPSSPIALVEKAGCALGALFLIGSISLTIFGLASLVFSMF